MSGEVEDPDATMVRARVPPAPSAPSVPASPKSPPLRDAVLGGAYFGASHSQTAEALASLVAGKSNTLTAWFGDNTQGDMPTLIAALTRDIAALDTMIARQLDRIL